VQTPSSRWLKFVHGLAGGRLPVSQLEALLRGDSIRKLEPVRLELDEEGSLVCWKKTLFSEHSDNGTACFEKCKQLLKYQNFFLL
jgi:hypothetical protein